MTIACIRTHQWAGCLLALFTALGLTGSLRAADRYWVGTSGSWAELSNWSTDPDNATPNPDAVPFFDDSFFNISSGSGDTVIDLNGNRAAESLNFTNTGTTRFRGNSSGTTARQLTVSPRGITMAAGAGAVNDRGRQWQRQSAISKQPEHHQ